MPDVYRLLGGPGSPYSLKMRAVLRYRRIPHTWQVPRGYLSTGPELKQAGKGIIPVLQIPEGDYWADSTPMIYALEERHRGARSVMPPDPARAFLSHLVEDFGDELLVQPMFAYRWSDPFDQQFCSRRQMAGWLGAMPAEKFNAIVDEFIKRQTGQLARMGTLQRNMPFLEDVYLRSLDAMEAMLDETDYLFGGRPSLADFGLYGQLSQCAIDPGASDIMKRRAPRVFQWTQTLDDACGNEGEWRPADASVTRGQRLMFDIVAKTYLPFLAANAAAIAEGRESFSLEIGGRRFEGRAARYRARCLAWLKAELSGLDEEARTKVREALCDERAWDMLQASAAEVAAAPPHVPL